MLTYPQVLNRYLELYKRRHAAFWKIVDRQMNDPDDPDLEKLQREFDYLDALFVRYATLLSEKVRETY